MYLLGSMHRDPPGPLCCCSTLVLNFSLLGWKKQCHLVVKIAGLNKWGAKLHLWYSCTWVGGQMTSRDDSRGFVFSEMKLNLRLLHGWCGGIDALLNSMPSGQVCMVSLISCGYTSSLIYFCVA